VSVAAVAGNATAVVSWEPGSSGACAVIDYEVSYSPGTAVVTVTEPTRTTTLTGLANGTVYTASVRQRSAGGWSGWTQSGSFTPVPNVPGAPASASTSNPHTEIAGGRDGVVTVSWTAAPRNGGPAIGAYSWSCSSTNGGVPRSGTEAGTASSRIVTGLTPGATYTCGVAASFAGGSQGPPASTGATIPTSKDELLAWVKANITRPTIVQLPNSTKGQVTLRWSAAPAGFGPRYAIKWDKNPPVYFNIGLPNSGTVSVSPCGKYAFRIRVTDKWNKSVDSESWYGGPSNC
jgi:hypothetical protein